MPWRMMLVGTVVVMVAMTACGAGSLPETPPDPSASATERRPVPSDPTSTSPEPPPSPSPSPSPSPEPDPLGPSRARLTVTGDIRTHLDLPLAAFDSFSATWCDARNCANAENSLQLMGEDIASPDTNGPTRGLFVTIEVQDRFLYVSGDQYTQGTCTVTFTQADERGFAGEIDCLNITNGTGLGVLTLTVRGTFVASA